MEPECTIWCPKCKTDKFVIIRKPADREGVCVHDLQAIDKTHGEEHLICLTCRGTLERKE